MKKHYNPIQFCSLFVLLSFYLDVASCQSNSTATVVKPDEFEDFTKWKAALDDVALRSLFDKYITEEPRTTDASGNATTKTVTAASASLSTGGGGTQDSNKLTPAGYPISVKEKTLNDGKDYEYTGINKSPTKPIQINAANQIQLAPYSNEKAVKLDLNGNDVLWIDSSSENQVEIMFRRGNGAQMKMNIYRITKLIDFEYISEFGKIYQTTKPAGDFQIANLVHDQDGGLKEEHGHSGKNFAIYRSADTDKGATLHIPSLELKLNLNYYDLTSCLEQNANKEHEETEIVEIHGDFSYALYGADWSIKYPQCGRPQQSPINLLDAVSKYGNSYKLFTSLEDNIKNIYGIAKAVSVYKDTQENRVIINLNNQDEYFGFSSLVGKTHFEAPEYWKASLIEFKYESEHTINDKRYGLEMQIYHTIDVAKSYKSSIATETGVSATHRRLAAADDERDSAESNALLEFKYAAISILFDVNDYTKNIPQGQLNVVSEFLDNINSEGRAFDSNFGKLMSSIDLQNRWIYKGSKTHPPCDQYVYWNIVKTVFPITQEKLDAFHYKIESLNAGNTVNYREIQKGLNRDVAFIRSQAYKIILSSGVTLLTLVVNL